MIKVLSSKKAPTEYFQTPTRKTIISLFVVVFLSGAFLLTFFQYAKHQDLRTFAAPIESVSFLETFDGTPAAPTPWNSANWDVVTNVSDSWNSGSNWENYNPIQAHHGTDCSAPLALHPVSNIYNSVFNCRDHMMTTIEGRGYGVVYLTPNHMVNFDNGEAVISFDAATFKSSGRQWWDLWIQPFKNNFQLPLESWLPAYHGKPKQAVSIKMEGETFNGFYVENFQQIDIPKTANGWKSVKQVLSEHGLEPSATRRDKFELKISKNHIKFGMPQYNHYWIDTDISDRGWSEGTVTLGHHEYNSSKDCTPNPPTDCVATTFHWDNFAINPAVPFTIIKGDTRGINATTGNRVTFPSPAPANAFLKFSAIGTIQASFDNGTTYQTIPKLQQEKDQAEHFSNYFTPIPAGNTSVLFKGSSDRYISQWMVRDPSIYAETVSTGGTFPTTTTAPLTKAPTETSTPIPSKTPTNIPTILTITPTRTPTPLPAGSSVIDFNNANTGPISGTYPTGVINWGKNAWYLSEPWKELTTKSVSFNGGGPKSGSFTFISPHVLKKIDAYADTGTTIVLSCPGSLVKQINIPAQTKTTISTDWISPCSTVTITSTNGWDTNFDNLVLAPANTVSTTPTTVFTTTPTPLLPTSTPTATPIPSPSQTMNSWVAEFFNNNSLTGTPVLVTLVDSLNYNWGLTSPGAGISSDKFSGKFTRTELFAAGTYTFTVSNDDGIIILLDGKVFYNNWKDQAASIRKFNKVISGGLHTITVLYSENRGFASLNVSWKKK